jgi:hypothetical protein
MADDDPDLDLSDELDIEDTAAAGSISQGKARTARGPTADQARTILQEDFIRVIDTALDWLNIWSCAEPEDRPDPPQQAFKVETGVGKSEGLRHAAVLHFIPEAARLGLPHRILKLVPTHRLAGEAASAMPAGVKVAVWQGRKATHLATAEPICLNIAAVEAAEKVGVPVENTACRHNKIRCPFYTKWVIARPATTLTADHWPKSWSGAAPPDGCASTVALEVVSNPCTACSVRVHGPALSSVAARCRAERSDACCGQGISLRDSDTRH